MVGLMERIAHQLAERVATLINVRTIFRRPAAEAMRRISEAQAMLEKWQLSYMKARPAAHLTDVHARLHFRR